MATRKRTTKAKRGTLKVAPIGAPLAADALIDRANVGEGDKLDAVTYWRARAPRQLRSLLEAKPRVKRNSTGGRG